MALIEVNFLSECLLRTVTLKAVIPFDKLCMPGASAETAGPYPTLYLLHGMFGNCTDWVSGTSIQRWAEEKNLAVIMPSGENHFYLDCEANGERFSEFIGRELPEKMRQLFPLSEKRSETFIGGLSMGGYGAIYNGLRFFDTFSYICGLSSGFMFNAMDNGTAWLSDPLFGKAFRRTIFGEPFTGGKNDARVLAERLAGAGAADAVFSAAAPDAAAAAGAVSAADAASASASDAAGTANAASASASDAAGTAKAYAAAGTEKLPKFYLCCGLEDSLLEDNRKFAAYLKDLGYSVIYEEGPGGHEWDFWNRYIKRFLDILPIP